MSANTYVQFYVFDENHFAVPIETLEPSDNLMLWAPAMAKISIATQHRVIYSAKQKWLESIPGCADWLLIEETKTKDSSSPDEPNIIVVLLTQMGQLNKKVLYHNLVLPNRKTKRRPLRVIKSRGKRNIDEELRWNKPVIMVGTEDIMGLFEEEEEPEIKKQRYKYSFNLDSRFKFWDSCIWHRYVPIAREGNTFDFQSRFQEVYDKMCGWYDDGLYTTLVALENIEFQTRLMLNSVIAEVGQHGHEERVTPFKFHSETQMEQRCEEILQELDDENGSDKTKLLETLQWDLLLVDDQAENSLSSLKSKQPARVTCKADIIKQLLNPKNGPVIFNVTASKSGTSGYIEEAFQMLRHKTYDVILLDYLLGDGMPERNGREYGYDFLSKLSHLFSSSNSSTSGPLPRKGPLGRFWIFPISSFPFAFADKLRQLGMDGYSTHWHLSGGGDPVCTPALFRYNFLNFVKQEISECYLNRDSRVNMVRKFSHINISDLWQHALLRHIERLELKKEVLEYDKNLDSLFAKKMLELKGKYPESNNELEDIKNLIANLPTASYHSYRAFLAKINDPVLAELLEERGNLYFDAETRFVQAIKNRNQATPEFVFERKALRWLPDEVAQLQNITSLDLSHNELTILPKSIIELKALEKLNLSHNRFSEIPAWILEEMTSLKTIDLKANSDLPEEMQQAKSIADLKALRLKNSTSRFQPIPISILYSSKDNDGFEALKPYLEQLSDLFLIEEQPLPGSGPDEWSIIIRKSKLCLAFISIDFLNESTPLLTIAATNNIPIVPIYWRECSAVLDSHPVLKARKLLPEFYIKGKTNVEEHLNSIVQYLKSIAASNFPKP